MTTELLPCPFCGGEAGYYASNEAVFGASWIGHVCHCKVCQGRVQTTAGMDASVAMWNERAAIQPQRMPDRETLARTAYAADPDLQVWRSTGEPNFTWEEIKNFPNAEDHCLPFYNISDAIIAITRPDDPPQSARVAVLDDELLIEWGRPDIIISIDDDGFGYAIRRGAQFDPGVSSKWSGAVKEIRDAIAALTRPEFSPIEKIEDGQ